MATVQVTRMPVQDVALRETLARASNTGGRDYELAMGGAITKRQLPVLAMIEAQTGVPIVGVSMERTRGPRSSQSKAWFQWQRGHRTDEIRWPDATIEFIGSGGVVSSIYALELSLQADFTRIGDSPRCRMSMGKASQIALTSAILASKPAYGNADIRYWYLCPWEPVEDTLCELLVPLQNMKGTQRVAVTWIVVD
jgi:hypothetical protein